MGKKFNQLATKIHREEHGKAIHGEVARHIEASQGREAAEAYIAKATAAKVFREQQAKRRR